MRSSVLSLSKRVDDGLVFEGRPDPLWQRRVRLFWLGPCGRPSSTPERICGCDFEIGSPLTPVLWFRPERGSMAIALCSGRRTLIRTTAGVAVGSDSVRPSSRCGWTACCCCAWPTAVLLSHPGTRGALVKVDLRR